MNTKAGTGLSGVIGATLVATLGGLLFGYDTAVISGAIQSIDNVLIAPFNLEEGARNTLSGFTIASALFGCIIGGLIAGRIADKLGRRAGLQLCSVLFIVSAIGSAFPELGFGPIGEMGPNALYPFVFYRILCGIAIGMASLLSPLYIAEIAPEAKRGRLVSLNQLTIVIGITLVYFVNWAIASLGDPSWLDRIGWRLMLLAEGVPALLMFGLLFFVPDTPRSLMLRGKQEAAMAVMAQLGGGQDATQFKAEVEASLDEGRKPLFHFGAQPVMVGVAIAIFSQISGINAVMYYAPQMFRNMGAGNETAFLQTILVGVVLSLFTVVAIWTVDRLGRRALLMSGGLVMAAAMLTLGLLFMNGHVGIWSLVTVLVFIAGFAWSWGPICFVVITEIFPGPIKGQALGIAVAAQWVANLFVSWTFKMLDESTTLNATFNHGLPYLIYAAMALLSVIFVARFLPETRGKRLETIQAMWEERSQNNSTS